MVAKTTIRLKNRGETIMTSVFSFPITTNKLLDEFYNVTETQFGKLNNSYPFDYYIRNDGAHVLEYALAGFKEDEIDVSIDNDQLIIKAEFDRQIDDTEKVTVFKRGISQRDMLAKFICDNRLLNLSKIEASFIDGILKIVLPESDESKNSKFTVKIN
jgi:HSP20 family molecular chaperone IbpA